MRGEYQKKTQIRQNETTVFHCRQATASLAWDTIPLHFSTISIVFVCFFAILISMKIRDPQFLDPVLRQRIDLLLVLANKHIILRRLNLYASITETIRTRELQMQYYSMGRTALGRIVTYCDGVINKSAHQANPQGLSEACDIALFDKTTKTANWKSKLGYCILGLLARKKCKLVWGGTFRFRDCAHFQLD